jgi:putative transposase
MSIAFRGGGQYVAPLVNEIKSVICYVATRRLGLSGEIAAKALGITRSGVCRGALRGADIIQQDLELADVVETLLTRSTTSP